MARRKRPPLMNEIARLLVEYPEKDWKILTDGLRNHTLAEEIATAIDDAVATVTKAVEKSKKKSHKPRESTIAKVARDDKAKAEKLAELKSRLTDQDQRLPIAYIRGFANSLGMKEQLAGRRDQAINQIVRYLATKTINEIEGILHTALPPQQTQGEEFDRWVNLILGRDEKSRDRNTPIPTTEMRNGRH